MKKQPIPKTTFIEYLCDSLNVSFYYCSISEDIAKTVKKGILKNQNFLYSEEYKFLNTQFFANFSISVLLLHSLIDGQNKKSYKEYSLSVYHSEYGFKLCKRYIELKNKYSRSFLPRFRNKVIAHNENIPGSTGLVHLGRITKAYFPKLKILKKHLLSIKNFMRDEFGNDYKNFPPLSTFKEN